MSDGGKGSSPRPFSVSQDKFASNWDAIFGQKKVESESDRVTRNNEETQEAKKKDNGK